MGTVKKSEKVFFSTGIKAGYCRNCKKKITIMIRRGGKSCSLECDRAMGIGKYADADDR